MQAVSEKISSKSLDDSETLFIGKLLEVDREGIDESIHPLLTIASLASILAIHSLMPAHAL